MGEQFAAVFDIAVIAVIICMFFAGWRQGFAKMVLSLASAAVAFASAMLLSAPIANAVYSNYIDDPLTEKVSETIDNALVEFHLGDYSGADFSRVEVSGTSVGEIEPNYNGTQSAVFDLTSLNFVMVGLTEDNMRSLGFTEHIVPSNLNAKTAEFTRSDIEKYGLGKLVYAQFAAVSLIQNGVFANFNKYYDIVAPYILNSKNYGNSESVKVAAVRNLVLVMLDTNSNVKTAVMDNMVRPGCVTVIRTIAFSLIFVVALAVMRLIIHAAKLIDKIPVLNKANSLLGGALGAAMGFVIVCLVCIITRLIVSAGGGDVMLFNETTINATAVFKKLYYADFLKFLS